MPVNLRVPVALRSFPVPFVTFALPETLKTCPASSPQPWEPEMTVNTSFERAPTRLPGPENGTHGCTEESPVPAPEILLAPTSVPVPLFPCRRILRASGPAFIGGGY